nr:MAG TPA: hypothetical protein [Crassvirales sp.]
MLTNLGFAHYILRQMVQHIRELVTSKKIVLYRLCLEMILNYIIINYRNWLLMLRDRQIKHQKDRLGVISGNIKDDMLMLILATLLQLINLRVLHTIL